LSLSSYQLSVKAASSNQRPNINEKLITDNFELITSLPVSSVSLTPHPIPHKGNVINLRGKPFWKRVFPLNPFPKTFKSFGKMAWKKPFFKRVSSKISARMLNLMTLPSQGQVFCKGSSKHHGKPLKSPLFTKGGNKKTSPCQAPLLPR
jgi:hypothetical protein